MVPLSFQTARYTSFSFYQCALWRKYFLMYETSLRMRQSVVTCFVIVAMLYIKAGILPCRKWIYLFKTMNDSLYVFICLCSYVVTRELNWTLALNVLIQHFQGKPRHPGCELRWTKVTGQYLHIRIYPVQVISNRIRETCVLKPDHSILTVYVLKITAVVFEQRARADLLAG